MDAAKVIEKMEVDEPQPSTSTKSPSHILAKNAQPSVNISLHPLVLMNIAEHWTRIRAQEGGVRPGKKNAIVFSIFVSHSLSFSIWSNHRQTGWTQDRSLQLIRAEIRDH